MKKPTLVRHGGWGKKFNTGAVTFSILRTKVGIYKIEKSLHLQ